MSAAGPHIAIITDDPGWHGRRLREAFATHGLTATMVSLTECYFDLNANPSGIVIPGFENQLPRGVFVRGVPGGTLEQVIVRLDILHALKIRGVPVYNDARAIERSVDKAMTSFLLHHAGIPTPMTWVIEDPLEASALILRETAAGHSLVMKPLFGSQGKGLIRLSAGDALPSPADYQGVYYLQRFVEPASEGSHDWRILVLGGEVDSAMIRRGSHWINNVAQGALCECGIPDAVLTQLALAATQALQMNYAGVDLIRGADGQALVLEVNSIPAWYGLQSVTQHSIAQHLVNDFVSLMPVAPPFLGSDPPRGLTPRGVCPQ